MNKVLRVIKPYFTLNEGDMFELSEDGTSYVYSENSENNEIIDNGFTMSEKHNYNLILSTEFASELLKAGILSDKVGKNTQFVNVFDEINLLHEKYTRELNNIEEDLKDFPPCVKLEKKTVMSNMIKLLEHLKNLKK